MNILGLSFYYHDSAAAVVRDGVLTAAIAEERISRVKHDSGFPTLAIEWALKESGISPSRTRLAIPFVGKDTPSLAAEFAQPGL